uniref:Centromere protein X n=1 Tax=Phascolarctos cinereus TaxID=38626 RepID=A0A6P5LKZ0_PHACI|nr:centromere protein X [Phascolarctos cinereus]
MVRGFEDPSPPSYTPTPASPIAEGEGETATSLTGRRQQRLGNQEARGALGKVVQREAWRRQELQVPGTLTGPWLRRSPGTGGWRRRADTCVRVVSGWGRTWSCGTRRRCLFPRPFLIGWYKTSGAGSPSSSRASAAEMEEDGPSFRKELVNKLLFLHFKNDRCKVSADALQLMVEMLKIFVREAAARAIRQAQAEDQDKVDIEQLEKVLPQLLLDF